MNIKFSISIIEKLIQSGVRDFCVCPGGRNAPLVKALQLFENIQTYFFYDERAAGFFALGKTKKSYQPTAVLTTSGTAVANLLPACIEAYYSGLNLIFVTADRPKKYRHTAAPQTIKQPPIFSEFVSSCLDIEVDDPCDIKLVYNQPFHLNLCFDEPLISDWGDYCDKKIKVSKTLDTEFISSNDFFNSAFSNKSPLDFENIEIKKSTFLEKWKKFKEKINSPLVVLGPNCKLDVVKKTLLEWKLPIYAEATSGFREDKDLSALMLKGGADFLILENIQDTFDSIIRIGPVPTLRLWRDLEFSLKNWPVFHFSSLPFPGLSRGEEEAFPLEYLASTFEDRFKNIENVFMNSQNYQKKVDQFVSEHPFDELSWIRKISEWIPKNSNLFLGNSLVIREWDQVASLEKNFKIQCNRGANGIDGLISTALGWFSSDVNNFCILGDLSAMYDMNGFQVLSQLNLKCHFIVINNGGGKIFTSLFKDPLFENQHKHNFKPIAEMFGLNYYLVNDILPEMTFQESSLIEVVPKSVI